MIEDKETYIRKATIQALMTSTTVLFLFEGLTKNEFEATFEILPEAIKWSVVRNVMGTEAAR